MKPFAPLLRKGVVRMLAFPLLASLLTSALFGAAITVRLTGEPGGEGGRGRAGVVGWRSGDSGAGAVLLSLRVLPGRKTQRLREPAVLEFTQRSGIFS